jgi:hypothetical protein
VCEQTSAKQNKKQFCSLLKRNILKNILPPDLYIGITFTILGIIKLSRQPSLVFDELLRQLKRFGLDLTAITAIGLLEFLGGLSLLLYFPDRHATEYLGVVPTLMRGVLVLLTGSAVAFHVSFDDQIFMALPAAIMFLCSLVLFLAVL